MAKHRQKRSPAPRPYDVLFQMVIGKWISQAVVDLQSAALYEEFTRRLLLEMANSPARPQWKAESFFRRYAGD